MTMLEAAVQGPIVNYAGGKRFWTQDYDNLRSAIFARVADLPMLARTDDLAQREMYREALIALRDSKVAAIRRIANDDACWERQVILDTCDGLDRIVAMVRHIDAELHTFAEAERAHLRPA